MSVQWASLFETNVSLFLNTILSLLLSTLWLAVLDRKRQFLMNQQIGSFLYFHFAVFGLNPVICYVLVCLTKLKCNIRIWDSLAVNNRGMFKSNQVLVTIKLQNVICKLDLRTPDNLYESDKSHSNIEWHNSALAWGTQLLPVAIVLVLS